MTPIFDADDLRCGHSLNESTKTVVLTQCWSVVFDVNGNAPENANVANFATEELAKQALRLFAAEKSGLAVSIVIANRRSFGLPRYSVEGYDFDTYYRVASGFWPEESILRSLGGLANLCGDECDTDLPDGVWVFAENDM